MLDDSLTLGVLLGLEDKIPELAGCLSRLTAIEYKDFIEILYRDIDKITVLQEENPEIYFQDQREDRLTVEIKNALNLMGYSASHDAKHGGHADLVVKKGSFTWIAEAKVYRGNAYLWQGYLQLTTRYSTGNTHQTDGALLIYVFQPHALSIMDQWMAELPTKSSSISTKKCPKKELCFYSSTPHQKSGLDFNVRHIPVLLYFDPQDNSGTKSKKSGSQKASQS